MKRSPIESGRIASSLHGWIVFVLLLLTACHHSLPQFTVERLPSYEALFQRTEGWTGGDGVFSVRLDSDSILWLFGDTFIGDVKNGQHVNAVLVNNTIAIQTGRKPSPDDIKFFYGKSAPDKPEALVKPQDGIGWYWPYHGVRTEEGLFLFLIQVNRAEGPSGFDFKLVATWLVKVPNPDDPPDRWRFIQEKIPWSHENRLFGSSILVKGEECFIYGTVEETTKGLPGKKMILAKAPLIQINDFGRWRFYSRGEWLKEADGAEFIAENVANEFSVSFQPGINRYLLVYTKDSLSEDIVFRLAPKPHGPWSEPVLVYRCPEAKWDSKVFCYAAKGHPELSQSPEELLFTYTTNSTDFSLIETDTRFYRPRFLKIRFQRP
jgi:hypothetical protein